MRHNNKTRKNLCLGVILFNFKQEHFPTSPFLGHIVAVSYKVSKFTATLFNMHSFFGSACSVGIEILAKMLLYWSWTCSREHHLLRFDCVLVYFWELAHFWEHCQDLSFANIKLIKLLTETFHGVVGWDKHDIVTEWKDREECGPLTTLSMSIFNHVYFFRW